MSAYFSNKLMLETDYKDRLNTQDRKWLTRALSALGSASLRYLMPIRAENALEMRRVCSRANDSRKRDFYHCGQRVDSQEIDQLRLAVSPLPFQEGTTVNPWEDAIIKLIDGDKDLNKKERKAVKDHPTLNAYGTEHTLSVGMEVTVCIEGHACDKAIGQVTSIRAGRFLVAIHKNSGSTVTMFLAPNEAKRVNTAKKVG